MCFAKSPRVSIWERAKVHTICPVWNKSWFRSKLPKSSVFAQRIKKLRERIDKHASPGGLVQPTRALKARSRDFSSTYATPMATCSRVPSLLADSAEDVVEAIFHQLYKQRDAASLVHLRSVSRALAPVARAVLESFTLSDVAKALARGDFPSELHMMAERRVAAALVDGKLQPDAVSAVMQYANTTADEPGHGYVLSSEPPGTDPYNDRSFRLKGFDLCPLEERGALVEWYADNLPSQPLRRLHVPCVVGAPPRYLALAGSQRDQRRVQRVPMELCRIVKSPAPTARGLVLIDAMLHLCQSSNLNAVAVS